MPPVLQQSGRQLQAHCMDRFRPALCSNVTHRVIAPVRNSQTGLHADALHVMVDIFLTVGCRDRLGCSLLVLVGALEELKYRRIELRSLTKQIDTMPGGRLIFQVLRSSC